MFSSDEWGLILEACEQRARQWRDQARGVGLPAQQEFCARQASDMNEVIARLRQQRNTSLVGGSEFQGRIESARQRVDETKRVDETTRGYEEKPLRKRLANSSAA